MAEIYIPAKPGPVLAAGERIWYAGPSSPVGRVLHCTDRPLRDATDVPVACWPEPMQLFPRVDRDGMRRCAVCCRAERVPAGYGTPPPPKRKGGVVLSDELATFVASWPLDAEDRPYTAAQLGCVTLKALEAEAKAAGMVLVGQPHWELVDDGTRHGSLVATTDARRVLTAAAGGRVAA